MAELAGVLLDLDGTLLDHRGAADQAARVWSQRFVPTETGDDPAQLWAVLESRYFRLFEQGECTFQEQRRRRVRAFHPDLAGLTDGQADAVFAGYLELYRAAWRPCPGAHEIVTRAISAGCRVGVLTNGEREQQMEKLSAIGLTQPELVLFASSDLGCAKPSARAFELACDGLGSSPARTVMIGDDAEIDILGARAAGLRAIHVVQGLASLGVDQVGSLTEAADLILQ